MHPLSGGPAYMNEFRADLHCHTTCSDGTLDPTEIIKLARSIGLSGLSITDHDSIEAYKIALEVAREHDLPLISGVEFSTHHRNTSIHLLAYSFDLESPVIKEFCLKHIVRRNQRNKEILRLLAAHQMPLTEEEIQVHDSNIPLKHTIGRPHIAMAMVRRGYVSSIQDAFRHYIGEGCPCYSPGGYFSVEETIECIKKAKGFAIIAHPHLIEDPKIIADLLKMDFDGLEGYYARFNQDQCQRWLNIAKKKDWLVTGGSDFHGDIKPNLPLGSSWVGEETFKVLYNHFISL